MQLSQVNISQKLQLIVRAAVHPMMIKWTLYVITDDGRRPNYRLSNEG